ncbi:hypothetical protein V1511DRAFT_507113 [Dipodascopsis uninucleata]
MSFSFGGSTQQNQQSGGLFGASKPSTPSFGNTPTSGGGSFGNNTNQQSNQANIGMFGGQNSSQQLGNRFGSNTSGGLFGAAVTNAPTPNVVTSGSNNNVISGASNGSSGLFGSSVANNGGIFGAKPAGGVGSGTAPRLFGSTGAGASVSGSNLFANPTTTSINNNGGFGVNANSSGTMFAKPALSGNTLTAQLQSNAQHPHVQITSLTRHSDLAESAQKELDEIDNYIIKQIEISDDLKARKQSRVEFMQSVPRDVEVLMRKLATTNQALSNDMASMTSQKQIVDVASQDVQLCIQLIQQLRIPGARLPLGDPLLNYFERHAQELERKIYDYRGVLAEVDRAVDGIESEIVKGQAAPSNTAEGVLRALHEEYVVFMALGNKVAELHHNVARLESREK